MGEPVAEFKCGECKACLKACPVSAPSGKNWNSTFDREDFFDVWKCYEKTKFEASRPEIGNRMRMLVEESFVMHEGKKLKVTISVGATLVQDGDTLENVVKRADTLLYESKNAGRNRITIV